MSAEKKVRIIVSDNGETRSIDLDENSCILGRGKKADVIIDSDLISRGHLKIVKNEDKFQLEELGSANGTWLNKEKIKNGKKYVYKEGNELKLGGPDGISVKIINLETRKKNSPASNHFQRPCLVPDEKTLAHKELREKIISINNSSKSNATKNTKESRHVSRITHQRLSEQLKFLISEESKTLKKIASKEANAIREQAKHEAEKIKLEAIDKASEIVNSSKESALKIKEEIKREIETLANENEVLKMQLTNEISTHKLLKAEVDKKISDLREMEAIELKKISKLKEELEQIQDKIKKENLQYENAKSIAESAVKINNLKMEELALEEKKVRSKIETDLSEAKAQTAKIFIEAEKLMEQRNQIMPELEMIKNEKNKIEKETNEFKNEHQKTKNELETLQRELLLLKDQIHQSSMENERICLETNQKLEMLSLESKKIELKEIELRKTTETTEQNLQNLIESAKKTAEDIIRSAESKKIDMSQIEQKNFHEIEEKKQILLEELYKGRETQLKIIDEEANRKKMSLSMEIEKLKIAKNELVLNNERILSESIHEAKKLNDSARLKYNNIVNAAIAEAQNLKNQTVDECKKYKDNFMNEIKAIKLKIKDELNEYKKSELEKLTENKTK